MAIMGKLRGFIAQDPVVAVSGLLAGVGLFLPAVVRPILESKQVPQPTVVAGMASKKQE